MSITATLAAILLFIPVAVVEHPGSTSIELAKVDHPIYMPGANSENALVVAVMRNGWVFFESDRVTPERLSSQVRERLTHARQDRIYMRVDACAKYSVVAGVLGSLRTAGITRVGFLVDQRRVPSTEPFQVFSGPGERVTSAVVEHYHRQTTREREVPGAFYFPPLASLITAGGRLLLALAEKCVTDAGGTYLFCDTDSLCVIADEKGGFARGGARADLGYVEGADMREFAPVPCLARDTVVKISERFAALNPYSFGGTILKVEDVNYVDGDPRKPFRDLHGYAISAKRYCLFEGKRVRKIVDSKAHGIGYLMNPVQRKGDKDEDQFAAAFWQCVLQNEGVSLKRVDPQWLDLPAMMRIPVSSPAVIGRLKNFCKPYDFVLAPVVRGGDLNLDKGANKPILVTRFAKASEEWSTATHFNARTGKPCRITTGEPTGKGVIAVRFLPFSTQCLREQCRSEIQRAGRKSMLLLDARHAAENTYRGGGTSLLRQGIQAETRTGTGGPRC